MLERIRDIRASEKRFYQKVRDLFAPSSDYDSTDKATQMFFAETQNKLLFAVTGKTAAKIVVSRANADSPNMALTFWKGAVAKKQDIFITKNYLSAFISVYASAHPWELGRNLAPLPAHY